MPPKSNYREVITTKGNTNMSTQNNEVTNKSSYYDKQSGCYGRETTKETVSSGDYVNRGRLGHKDEYKSTTTTRFGDKEGYIEHSQQERFTCVDYNDELNYMNNSDDDSDYGVRVDDEDDGFDYGLSFDDDDDGVSFDDDDDADYGVHIDDDDDDDGGGGDYGSHDEDDDWGVHVNANDDDGNASEGDYRDDDASFDDGGAAYDENSGCDFDFDDY